MKTDNDKMLQPNPNNQPVAGLDTIFALLYNPRERERKKGFSRDFTGCPLQVGINGRL
jgi:hypothetical protein